MNYYGFEGYSQNPGVLQCRLRICFVIIKQGLISHNPIQHDPTKHVEVDRHFSKEKLDGNIIQFPFVKSDDQLANILTKAVASQAFYNSLVKLGMNDIYAPTSWGVLES